MPLVYVPDHHVPGTASLPYGLGLSHPSYPAFGSSHPSYAPAADPIAARKQALLAEFARSLDEQYTTAGYPSAVPVYGQYSHQHQLHQQLLLQQQQQREREQQQQYLAQLERQRAEVALLEAVEQERHRQVLRRKAALAAAAAAEKEQARQRAERQRRLEAEQQQEQALMEALHEHAIRQQRQAAYERQVAEQQRRRQQQQQQQQQQARHRIESRHPLENFLNLLAQAEQDEAEEHLPAPARTPAPSGPAPSARPTEQDASAALEAFLGQLFGHCASPSSPAPKQASSKPAEAPAVKPQPSATYHYIPHPSVAGPAAVRPASSTSTSTSTSTPVTTPARPSTPSARATPAPVSRSSSPARSSASSPSATPHQKLSALFARLRSAASEANSLTELQHRLTTLLVEADAIEAGGDAAVRSRRKELVCEVEKVLGALERKEAARLDAAVTSSSAPVAEQVETAKPEDSVAAPSAALVAVKEPAPTASAAADEAAKPEPSPASPPASAETPAAPPAPVFIPIGSPTPASPRALPTADNDDDARSDVSSVASPLLTATAAAPDDDTRSVTSSRSSSSSCRGRKAYVEDAPEEDGFQML